MATIVDYVAYGTHSGLKETIWLQVVFFYNVGSGQIEEYGTFNLSFQGHIDCIFYKGPLNLSLDLTDKNPGAHSGPCSVSVNGIKDPNAKYHVDNSKLSVDCNLSGNKQTITLYRIYEGKQTQIDLTGKISCAVHLVPA